MNLFKNVEIIKFNKKIEEINKKQEILETKIDDIKLLLKEMDNKVSVFCSNMSKYINSNSNNNIDRGDNKYV